MSEVLPRLQAVEEEIQAALARAQGILDFVAAQQVQPEIRVAILNNVIVALVSIIEEGLRTLFSEYIAIIEEQIGGYSKMRGELTDANLQSASELLKRSLDSNRKIDPLIVTRDLMRCLNDESGFKLFKEEITFNRYNMRSKHVSDLAKKVGIKKLWDDIQTRPPAVALYPEASADQRQQMIVERWNALFDERDTIVHRISQANGWGETIIAPYIEFLKSITSCFVLSLAEDASAFLLSPRQLAGDMTASNVKQQRE